MKVIINHPLEADLVVTNSLKHLSSNDDHCEESREQIANKRLCTTKKAQHPQLKGHISVSNAGTVDEPNNHDVLWCE
jgi:hypothetical protein